MTQYSLIIFMIIFYSNLLPSLPVDGAYAILPCLPYTSPAYFRNRHKPYNNPFNNNNNNNNTEDNNINNYKNNNINNNVNSSIRISNNVHKHRLAFYAGRFHFYNHHSHHHHHHDHQVSHHHGNQHGGRRHSSESMLSYYWQWYEQGMWNNYDEHTAAIIEVRCFGFCVCASVCVFFRRLVCVLGRECLEGFCLKYFCVCYRFFSVFFYNNKNFVRHIQASTPRVTPHTFTTHQTTTHLHHPSNHHTSSPPIKSPHTFTTQQTTTHPPQKAYTSKEKAVRVEPQEGDVIDIDFKLMMQLRLDDEEDDEEEEESRKVIRRVLKDTSDVALRPYAGEFEEVVRGWWWWLGRIGWGGWRLDECWLVGGGWKSVWWLCGMVFKPR